MTTSISIRNVVKRFGTGRASVAAVDGVSLEIEPGQLYFLLGPSGCGKTTLLRMIAGFNEPTSGAIAFGGRDVTHLPPNRRNTGMVFQSYALWPHMTVEQNVGFGLKVRKVSRSERHKRVREALEQVRMEHLGRRKPTELSGGQQQRVALARALVVRPEVLLLDEPLSNLDAALRVELRGEIRRVCKDAGITTVYVTHDQKEALSIADRIALMRDGKAVQVGAPADLYRRPGSRFVAEFLGETNLLAGEVVGSDDGMVLVRTSAGEVGAVARSNPWESKGARVLASIRPEALRMSSNGQGAGELGRLRGRVEHTVYLGEVAQHTIEVKPGVRLRASVLNPVPAHEPDSGREVSLTVDPSDVALVPEE